jgi:quercetin dioxygenase-like cupin family protein
MRWISGNASSTGTNAFPQIVNVLLYPALNTLGISHGRLDFDIGGVIPPHTHPFASETLFVVKGTVYTGFISFDNILYAETLQEGDVYIFPKGSLHFQLNVGNGPAVTFNSLNIFPESWILVCSKPAASDQNPGESP